MNDKDILIPVKGAWVKLEGKQEPGKVIRSQAKSSDNLVQIEWLKSHTTEWIPRHKLRCGFQLGLEVQDCPRSRYRPSLGEGIVLETRCLGQREQVLVEFPTSGRRQWLPWENLKQIKGVRQRFLLGQTDGDAEAFRLRCLAHALELWNENTGSLSHLEIDPLPHQIHLVHRILASGNLNWLIADDVGLGKTIEVGMLLAALKQRGMFRRVLVVTPAGLTRQWQEELRYKFNMDDFQIYGEDFRINDPVQWKLYDHVIGSIDRFKMEPHLGTLMEGSFWDIIVFDEAHRLSRRQWGMKYEASERFRLAAMLRNKTDALVLLSATPHQGMQDKFQALLELLRPEWKPDIDLLNLNPQILRHMVVRNHKADVTDAEGNFIFKGKITRAIQVNIGKEAREFDRALQDYLNRGYAASAMEEKQQGRAIGFVMTVYRKLAASSVKAIHEALQRRVDRLMDTLRRQQIPSDTDTEFDSRFAGEEEERIATSEKEFFSGEITLLNELIGKAQELIRNDFKLKAFIEELVALVLTHNPQEKVVIFTEYRATQSYLADALNERFGAGKVELINGSQDHTVRASAIARFEDHAQFLISTEAGGEGINLHRRCHVMVNFDLPWNPMRLVQRIGRLYRYGQQKQVVVFNIHAPQTLDAEIMELLYDRIQQVVNDLSVLGDEFKAGLEDEILGELAELMDVEEILEEAQILGIKRTQERIEEALHRAKEAVSKQRELFEYVVGYDPNETRHELRITSEHLRAFVEGAFRSLNIEIVATWHKGAVWEIRLPPELVEKMPGNRSRWRVTLDRTWGANRPDIHMLDLESPLMQFLLERVKAYGAGGLAGPLKSLSGRALLTAILRWQNDQGQRMRQEYAALLVHNDGRVEINSQSFSDWLLKTAQSGSAVHDRQTAKDLFVAAEQATDRRLGEVSNLDLHPENRQWINGGWL